MSDDRDITIGEVVRLLQRQDEQLALILAEAKKTNGNVIRHELRLDGLDREVRDLKRRPAGPKPATGDDAAARDGIVITVPTNGKTIAALLLALVSLLAAWKAGGL